MKIYWYDLCDDYFFLFDDMLWECDSYGTWSGGFILTDNFELVAEI